MNAEQQLEQMVEMGDKIEENILTKTGITELEYEVMTTMITGEKAICAPNLVMDVQRNGEIWFKTMSSHGLFDKQMADMIEQYLIRHGAMYNRIDRHFYVNGQDFFRLFGES